MDSKVSITIATGIYPPDVGGPATFVVAAERAWQDKGYDVRVLAFTSFRSFPKIIRHVLYTFRLFRIAKGSSVILALDPVSVGLPTLVVSRMRGIPYVLRLVGDYAWEQYMQSHDSVSLEEFQNAQVPLRFAFLRKVERAVARHAALVIVPSTYLATITHAWGIPESCTHVVYNMITPSDIQKHVYAQNGKFRFLAVGRLVPWKGFVFLCEVIAQIPGSTLTIIGSGPQEQAIRDILRERKIEDRVTIQQSIPREKFRASIVDFDAFVFPSSYEGFSHALIEVMSAGLPIITTAEGGNREVVKHKENAIVCAPNDAAAWKESMSMLMCDESLREKYGKRAAQDAKHFYGSDMLDHYLQLILRLL